jgi:hypothetical protein
LGGGGAEEDDVAGVGAAWGGGEGEVGGAIEAEVLVGMDGEIDLTGEQGGVQFGDEELAALGCGEGDIEQLIAAGFDADQLDAEARVEGFQLAGDPGALGLGEEGAAGSEAEGVAGRLGLGLAHGAMGRRDSGEGGLAMDEVGVEVLGVDVRLILIRGVGFPGGEGGEVLPAVGDAEGGAEGAEAGAFAAGAFGAADVGELGAGLLVMEEEDVVEGMEAGDIGPAAGLGVGAAEVEDEWGDGAGEGGAGLEGADAVVVAGGIEGDAEDDAVGLAPGGGGEVVGDDGDALSAVAVVAEGLGEGFGPGGVAVEEMEVESGEPGGDGLGQFTGADEEEGATGGVGDGVEPAADEAAVGGAAHIGEVAGADFLGVLEQALEPGEVGSVGCPGGFDLTEDVGFALETAGEAGGDAEEEGVGVLAGEPFHAGGCGDGVGGFEDADPALAGVEDEGGSGAGGDGAGRGRGALALAEVENGQPAQHDGILSQAREGVSRKCHGIQIVEAERDLEVDEGSGIPVVDVVGGPDGGVAGGGWWVVGGWVDQASVWAIGVTIR